MYMIYSVQSLPMDLTMSCHIIIYMYLPVRYHIIFFIILENDCRCLNTKLRKNVFNYILKVKFNEHDLIINVYLASHKILPFYLYVQMQKSYTGTSIKLTGKYSDKVLIMLLYTRILTYQVDIVIIYN